PSIPKKNGTALDGASHAGQSAVQGIGRPARPSAKATREKESNMVSKSMVLAVVLSGLSLLSGGLARAEQSQPSQPNNTSNVKKNGKNEENTTENKTPPNRIYRPLLQKKDVGTKAKPAPKKSSGVQDQD